MNTSVKSIIQGLKEARAISKVLAENESLRSKNEELIKLSIQARKALEPFATQDACNRLKYGGCKTQRCLMRAAYNNPRQEITDNGECDYFFAHEVSEKIKAILDE